MLCKAKQALVIGHSLPAPFLMFDSQCFGILGVFRCSNLLYGKVHTDHIYKGNNNEPYGPYNQNPNRAEGEKKLNKPNNTRVVGRVVTVSGDKIEGLNEGGN